MPASVLVAFACPPSAYGDDGRIRTGWLSYQQVTETFAELDRANRTPVAFECRDSGGVGDEGTPQPQARVTSRPSRKGERWRWVWGNLNAAFVQKAKNETLTLFSEDRYHTHPNAVCRLWLLMRDTVG